MLLGGIPCDTPFPFTSILPLTKKVSFPWPIQQGCRFHSKNTNMNVDDSNEGNKCNFEEKVLRIVGSVSIGDTSLSVEDRLSDAGIDSLGYMELFNLLKAEFSLHPSRTSGDFYLTCSTVGDVIRYVEEGIALEGHSLPDDSMKEVVVLRNGNIGSPVAWFIHGVDGNVTSLAKMCSYLPWTCYGIQLTEGTRNQCHNMVDLARRYLELMKQHSTGEGNFLAGSIIVGYSFGAVIAHEVVHQMESLDLVHPKCLLLVDMQVEWPYLPWVREWKGATYEAIELACRSFAGETFDDTIWLKRCQRLGIETDESDLLALSIGYYMPETLSAREWKQLIESWCREI